MIRTGSLLAVLLPCAAVVAALTAGAAGGFAGNAAPAVATQAAAGTVHASREHVAPSPVPAKAEPVADAAPRRAGPAPAGAAADDSLDCLIEPLMVVQVGTRADGVLDEVLVDRGDGVQRGQLIASLDSAPERAALALARARADIDLQVRSALVKLGYGARRAERLTDVRMADSITDLEKDEAVTAERLARLQVSEARKSREVAVLEVARVEALLEQRRVVSPIDGVVVERLMNPGERVTDTPVVTLAQIDPLKVEVIVPVAMLGKVQVGTRAVVVPEAPLDGEHAATVTVVDRVIDARSGTFGVRLELPNPDHGLPGGLRCRVRFLPGEPAPPSPQPAPASSSPPPDGASPPADVAPTPSPASLQEAAGEPAESRQAESVADAAVEPPLPPPAEAAATPAAPHVEQRMPAALQEAASDADEDLGTDTLASGTDDTPVHERHTERGPPAAVPEPRVATADAGDEASTAVSPRAARVSAPLPLEAAMHAGGTPHRSAAVAEAVPLRAAFTPQSPPVARRTPPIAAPKLAPRPPVCVEVGPLAADEAARVQALAEASGWSAQTPADASPTMQVVTVALMDGDRAGTMRRLQQAGFHDVGLMTDGAYRGQVSVGVFGEAANARTRRDAVRAAGFTAELLPWDPAGPTRLLLRADAAKPLPDGIESTPVDCR